MNRKSNFNYYSGKPVGSPKNTGKGPRGIFKYKLVSLAFNWITILLLLIALGYSMIIQPQSSVSTSNEYYRSTSDYRNEINNQLNRLVNRSKATINETSISEDLKTKFPEILSVKVDLPLVGQKPHVDLQISDPVMILQSDTRKYVINSYGVAVGYLEGLKSTPDAPLVIDQTGYKVEIGKAVLTSGDVSFISLIVGQCKALNIPIKNFNLPSKAREVELYTTDRNYVTRFTLNNDPRGQVGEYLAARDKLVGAKNPSQYLDVRVIGKIYYQ